MIWEVIILRLSFVVDLSNLNSEGRGFFYFIEGASTYLEHVVKFPWLKILTTSTTCCNHWTFWWKISMKSRELWYKIGINFKIVEFWCYLGAVLIFYDRGSAHSFPLLVLLSLKTQVLKKNKQSSALISVEYSSKHSKCLWGNPQIRHWMLKNHHKNHQEDIHQSWILSKMKRFLPKMMLKLIWSLTDLKE